MTDSLCISAVLFQDSCSQGSTIQPKIKLQGGRENIKDSLTDGRKRQKIKSQVANEVSTQAKIDQQDDPRYEIWNSKCKTGENGCCGCVLCVTHRALAGCWAALPPLVTMWVWVGWNHSKAAAPSSFMVKWILWKRHVSLFMLSCEITLKFQCFCVCVSKSVYVDVFTWSKIKRCANICINRYLYFHPSLLLHTVLCDKPHTWNSFLCQTVISSDHRPVSKFCRTRTKFSRNSTEFPKEACHVPEP